MEERILKALNLIKEHEAKAKLGTLTPQDELSIVPRLIQVYSEKPEGFGFTLNRPSGYISEKETTESFFEWAIAKARLDASKASRSDILSGGCINASQSIDDSASLAPLEITNLKINTADHFGGNFKHTMNILEIEGKKYIVDPTFIQFFSKVYDLAEFRRVISKNNVSVYDYFMATEKRKAFAKELAKIGFVEATDENIKMYFDCWTLVNKRHEKNPTAKVETSAEEYLGLLSGAKTFE